MVPNFTSRKAKNINFKVKYNSFIKIILINLKRSYLRIHSGSRYAAAVNV